MDDLSPSELRIAKVLLAAYPIAGLETVAELAARARVSGATVVRFVRHLGFDGYPAFHQTLREEVQEGIVSPVTRYKALGSSPLNGDAGEALRLFEAALARTFSGVADTDLMKIASLLGDSTRRVMCTGGRFSGMMAQYLHRHLRQIRGQSEYIPANSERAEYLLDVTRKDVLFVFDFRRYQADTVSFARACRARGATLVLITDRWLSPISEISRHVLMCDVEGPPPYDSFVPTIAVIEALIAAVVRTLGESVRTRLEALEDARVEVSPSHELADTTHAKTVGSGAR